MPNALSALSGPPPAPNPDPQGQPSGGMPMTALGPSPGQQHASAGPPPAPSHQQTVAALRHFAAIERELTTLLKDPDLGKADLKSKIIDGTTGLVAGGYLTPAAAVTELGTVPERPFEQKKWLEQHFQQTIAAANQVLGHHQAAFPGGAPNEEAPSMDNHHDLMQGLASNYQGRANGR